MSEQTAPHFVDELGGILAPSAPPIPRLNPELVARRRRIFAVQMDYYLLAVVAVLCSIGLLMVYSASIDASFLATEDRSTTYFFRRQLFPNLFVGLILMYGLARLDYRILRRWSVVMMFGIIVSLILVLVVGDERLQARRALISGSYQPGEAAKMVVVIYMAAWLASKRNRLRKVTYGILPFSIMVGSVATLVVLQPDISTAASILATSLTMFFLAGASWFQLSVVVVGAAVGGWTIATKFEYAQRRINDHLAAINNLTLANDHVRAAIVAFLDGGLFGVGLGEGRQKYVIPFPHTDSVFAVIGEELGLFGCFVVIILYVVMVYRGFVIARNALDTFGGLLAAGITIWLTYDALLNIAVMTALVPPTGVPLPFISFGGSSLVSAMAGIGLVLSVSRVSAQVPLAERQRLTEAAAVEPPRPEPKPAPVKKPPAEKKTVEKARQQRRLDAIERSRQAAPVTPEVFATTEQMTDVLADVEVPIEIPTTETIPDESYVQPDTTQEGNQLDPDSDLSGRNRRGRISRISCR